MTIADLRKLLPQQILDENPALTKLLARLKGLPFYCNSGSGTICDSRCFWHMFTPEKNGVKMPMFPYEQQIYDLLFLQENSFKDKHVWCKKATGL